MIIKYVVHYFVPSESMTGGGYTTPKEFDTRAAAADFAQVEYDKHPKHAPSIYERRYREAHEPRQCDHCGIEETPEEPFVEEFSDTFSCQECHENCDHDWDFDEGGMCMNCGRDDYWNYMGD